MKTEDLDRKLVERLAKALATRPATARYKSEAHFEHRFVEPLCAELLGKSYCVAVHPWRDKMKAPAWRASKEWGAVRAWGMQHAFDLVARHCETGKSIAVEVKLARTKGGRMPNADFQRMMGQCILARLKHQAVIGVFGHVGKLRPRWEEETLAIRKRLEQDFNLWIVVRQVQGVLGRPA